MPLSSYSKQVIAPGRTLVLKPSVFADEWADKPREDVCVGLRLMSEEQKFTARRDSDEFARELHPKGGGNQIDAFNDALMRQLVAFGLCDPNDVSRPWEGMDTPENDVQFALTSQGVVFIYQAIRLYEIESGAAHREITNDEFPMLFEELEIGTLDSLPSGRQGELRRLLGYVLDELRDVD